MISRTIQGDLEKPPPAWEFPLLVALAMAGALGRFLNLGAWSLELDEALFLADARHEDGLNYPLGYWFARWIWDLFAQDAPAEWLLRLPSALVGALSVPATFWAARALVDRRVAALAAALVALSAWALFWSQMARFYALTQFVCLLSGGFVLRGVVRGSWGLLILGGLIGAAAPFCHPSGGLFLGGLWFAVMAWYWLKDEPTETQRDIRRVFLAASVAGVAVGLWWGAKILGVWQANTRGIASNPLHLIKSAGYYVTPWLGLAFIIGLIASSQSRKPEDAALCTLVVGAGVLALAASFIDRFAAQYVYFLFPWVVMVAAYGIRRLWFDRTAMFIALGLCLANSAHYHLARHGDRPRWRDAAAFLVENSRPGDLYVGMHAPALEYYLNPGSSRLREPVALAYLDRHRSDHLQRWSQERRRVWIVVNPEEFKDWSGRDRDDTADFIRSGCWSAAKFPIAYPLGVRDLDVNVWLWSR